MNRFISISLALLMLAGCSTIRDRSTQDMTIETPGASGALCLLQREGFRDRIWAPKTVRIQKADEPLTITCRAPGNREKTLVIEPTVSRNFHRNVYNFFLGAAYDYESSAMYLLPEKVVVDFTSMKPQTMPLPDYQEVLDANPDIMRVEQFFPGAAAMNKDKTYRAPVLEPRKPSAELFGDIGSDEGTELSAGEMGGEVAPPPAPGGAGESAGAKAEGGGKAESSTKGGIPDLIFPADQLPKLNQ